MAEYRSPISEKRASRFIWTPDQITVIRTGDERSPTVDAKSDQPEPDAETSHLAGKSYDKEQKNKP